MGDNILQHWGVLGMRWGVRKDSNAMSRGKAISRNTDLLNSMSDQELREVIGRIQLETQLGALTNSIKKGKGFMSTIGDALKDTTGRVVKEASYAAVKKIWEELKSDGLTDEKKKKD